MKIKSIIVFIVSSLFLFDQTVFAVNGTKLIGNGAVSPVMGGTGCVEPQDTAGILINPAGITKIGKRIDTAMEFALIDSSLDTSDSPHPYFTNSEGNQESTATTIWIPHFGFAGQFGESDWYYGFASAIVSGLKVDYESSRLSETATNNEFDKHLELSTAELVPTIAYKPIEKLSLGASGVMTVTYFQGDLSTAAFTETKGRDHSEFTAGIGFNVGLVYDICDYVSAGFSYKSRRWNDEHYKYDDVAKDMDGPAEYIWGIAVKPCDNLLLESNVKFIDWNSIPIMEKDPIDGGYGWKDQWVFGFGAQYALSERLKLRAGYNYGKSPIRDNVVYANALSSVITEHHLGIGLGYKINDRFSADAGWVHTFEKTLTDSGHGDTYSQNGKGTTTSLGVDAFLLGFSYHFN
jgi:long-chain fatty acid transport protein